MMFWTLFSLLWLLVGVFPIIGASSCVTRGLWIALYIMNLALWFD